MGKGNIKATMKRLKHRVFYEDLFVRDYEKFAKLWQRLCIISKTLSELKVLKISLDIKKADLKI